MVDGVRWLSLNWRAVVMDAIWRVPKPIIWAFWPILNLLEVGHYNAREKRINAMFAHEASPADVRALLRRLYVASLPLAAEGPEADGQVDWCAWRDAIYDIAEADGHAFPVRTISYRGGYTRVGGSEATF